MCVMFACRQGVEGPVSGYPGVRGLGHLADPVLRADRHWPDALGGDPERQSDGAGAVQRHRPGHAGRHAADPAAQVRRAPCR